MENPSFSMLRVQAKWGVMPDNTSVQARQGGGISAADPSPHLNLHIAEMGLISS